MEMNGKFSEQWLFSLLSDSVCEYMERETRLSLNGDKKAALEVTAKFPGFVIRDLDKKIHIQSIPFCNQSIDEIKSCADHAIFLFHPEGKVWSLHIFEFKTSIGRLTWDKVREQFNGAMVRAYAIAGVLRIPEFSGGVFLHCVYQNYRSGHRSPIEAKTHEGKSEKFVSKDFLKEPIPLHSYPKLASKNIPIQLDDNGYAEIILDTRGCTVIPRGT